MTIENPYPELIIGFVGNGSIDNPVVLQPNQSLNLTLAMHTQDVTIFDYDLVARLTANDGGDPIQDAIPINLHVHVPNVDLLLEEISSDPISLVKRYRLTNQGDPLTDIAITANLTGTGTVYLTPNMSHGYLQTGQSFEFEAVPVIEPGFVGVVGDIEASAAGETTALPIDLSLPPGYAVYLGEANNMSMEASAGDWYCTNRPVINNKITLPAGFRHEDVVSAQFRFVANPRPDARPHDVSIYVNNEPIGSLTNIIPRGLYTFPIDPTFLNEADGRPSVNYVKLVTRHMNGGHYVVANNMLISICLSSYREWVPAASQTQADDIVSGRSYLIPPPGLLDATILTPDEEQTLYAGVPTNITVQVVDDIGRPWSYAVTVQADNGNGGVILFDDGYHGDGAARDGVYGGSWTPVNSGPTTLTVEAASCSIAGNHQITVNVETLDHAVTVDHAVPVTGTSILNMTPLPQSVISGTDQTNVIWAYTLTGAEPDQATSLNLQLDDMQAGEMRQISNGTVISYTGVGGSGVIQLPPLFVAAPHLVAIAPDAQTANNDSTVTYDVTLYNPGTTAVTLTPHISGLPASWVRFAESVTLAADTQTTLPLSITIPDGAASSENAFAVIVETPTGGQDQASALLTVADLLDIAVTPTFAVVDSGEAISYTVTVTNLAGTTQTFALAVDGLDDSTVTLANTVTLAAASSQTLPLQVTAYESEGVHAFAVRATAVTNAATASADASLAVLGDYHVQASLAPTVMVGGRNTPLPYTLTVRNAGNLADLYTLSASVPAGWTYEFSANGTAVTNLT